MLWLWIVATIVVGVVMISILVLHRRQSFRIEPLRCVGPPTKLSLPFQLINIIGDEIYRPLVKKPFYYLSLKNMQKHCLPLEIEETVLGPTTKNFYEGLELLERSILDKKCYFTSTGHIALAELVKLHVKVRKVVIKYLYDLKQMQVQLPAVKRPIIITGLPRTGSTLLFSLLAQDRRSRVLRNWEMFEPLPPPTKETIDSDPRIETVRKLQKLVSIIQPNYTDEVWKLHYYEAGSVEEELLVMLPHLMLMPQAILLHPESEFSKWYLKQEGKEFVYSFLRQFIQVMGTNYHPESHWVLKAPIHSLFPEELMNAFPDASIIVPHRDPCEVIPSWTKLSLYVLAHYVDEYDSRFKVDGPMICRNTANHMSEKAKRLMDYREQHPEKKNQFLDINYHQLISDPIGTVRRIYEYFGYEYSDEFEANMKQWLRDNQQGKYGRVKYSLEEFGIRRDEVDKMFEKYLSLYPCHPEKSKIV